MSADQPIERTTSRPKTDTQGVPFQLVKHSDLQLKFVKDIGEKHFYKHSPSIQTALGKNSYTYKEYIADANYVINNGVYAKELNGFVKIIGGKGNAKVAFVGISSQENIITTFHIKSVSEVARKAPSLGWQKK
ncbi:MAG: hypothetical protein K0M45_05595 [Candidatus Paracaedibacteraceae bacterium]|nr:hypothetical protein [Candidatus Paracaedibacteraceae bacterium]